MLLTLLLLIPAIGAVASAFAPEKGARTVAAVFSAITLVLSLFVASTTGNGGSDFYATENHAWLPALRIGYLLGVDGPSALLVALTAFLTLMAALFAPLSILRREREFYALLLALEATVIGCFVALDLVLFYIFFEACLIPAYFLIGIWGGRRRIQAATKFFVYTVVGSLVMLASIIGLYLHYQTFSIPDLMAAMARSPLGTTEGLLIFGGFAVAFAVKTGLFPLHTWLPDTYAEAPAIVTAILSGSLAKLGTYGFYRFGVQLLPDAAAAYAPFLIGLGVVSIIYGALVATVQRDILRVLAYSSISHLGFVVVGLFAGTEVATSGAIQQMVNHGISSGMLFFLAALILNRRGTTNLRGLGGLWEQTPVLARFFLIATLSSIGLPLTNGFVGEFLILVGTFQTFPWLTALATTGVIWSAVYMLWMYQRAFYGPVANPLNRRFGDVSSRERALLTPFVALIFLLGIAPGVMSGLISAPSEAVAIRLHDALLPHTPKQQSQQRLRATPRPEPTVRANPATPIETPSPAASVEAPVASPSSAPSEAPAATPTPAVTATP